MTSRFRSLAVESSILALVYSLITVWWFSGELGGLTRLVHGGSDGFNYSWRIWWFAGGFRLWGGDPLFAPSVFYPQGHRLAEAELTPLQMIPAVLISKLTGPVFGYNLVVFASFVAAGIAAYAYLRFLRVSRPASFVGGLIYSFAPYHTSHALGHLPLMGMWVLPFGLLAIEGVRRSLGDESRRARWAWSVAAGLAVAAAAWSSWYYFLSFSLAFAVYALVRLRGSGWRKTAPWGLVALSVSFALVLPLYLLVKATADTSSLDWPLSAYHGASPLAFVVPSYVQRWWGMWWVNAYQPRNAIENSLFLGWLPLALAAFGWVTRKRRPSGKPWKALAVVFVVFVVMSLGPFLYVSGTEGVFLPWRMPTVHVPGIGVLPYAGHAMPIPLPSLPLIYAPFFDGMRESTRYGVIVAMAVAAMAAIGLDALASRLALRLPRHGATVVAALVAAVVLVEFAPLSYTLDASPRPVDRFIASREGPGTVMWGPSAKLHGDEEMYRTSITGKAIAFGDSTHTPPTVSQDMRAMDEFPSARSLEGLSRRNVRWIVWDESAAGPVRGDTAPFDQVARFDDLVVYEKESGR